MAKRNLKKQLVNCAKIMSFKPLELRTENNVMYPVLSAVVRDILAVPFHSASSERVFSRMTSIISSSGKSLVE